MRKYPIGIQSFKSLRNDGYVYIDKTSFVKRLVDSGKYYFLSRPRRFGKSLFVDTLRQAFLGERELFKGLFLEDNWDWTKKHPVLKISFGSGVHRNLDELRQTMESMLIDWRRHLGIEYEKRGIQNQFSEAIEKAYELYGERVVVLIDEYDKPILDNISNVPLATELREELKNFYSVLKDADEYLKLVFITGVSKFSKVSLFSGLNNLKDITIDASYSSLCGYTQTELEETFAEELKSHDIEKVKEWYNGFSWGNGTVYNPFDILLFIDSGKYKNYWFESGTPSFLLKLMDRKGYFIPDLERLEASEAIASSFEIEEIELETLLFQTGYLTIKEIRSVGSRDTFILSYPNLEVRMSLNDSLLAHCSVRSSAKERNIVALYRALEANDLDGVKDIFHSFYASIPVDWFRRNDIAEYEGFYASVFYSYFTALGLDVRVEDPTKHGKIDMTVLFDGRCYIFEFKVVEYVRDANSALEQIKERNYAEKYAADFAETYLIGVEFSKTDRNITRYEWERFSTPDDAPAR